MSVKNIFLQTLHFWRHLLYSVILLKYFCRHLKYNTFLVALPLFRFLVTAKSSGSKALLDISNVLGNFIKLFIKLSLNTLCYSLGQLCSGYFWLLCLDTRAELTTTSSVLLFWIEGIQFIILSCQLFQLPSNSITTKQKSYICTMGVWIPTKFPNIAILSD